MELKPLTWGKGMNKDVLSSELPDGFCSDAINARFRNGFALRAAGVVDATTSYLASIGTAPEWLDLYASTSSATGRYLVYAGATKVYADNLASTKTEITRYTEGVVISSITSVGTTATLTTATNHGRTTGDTVSIWGCVSTNYNVTAVITVTGVTTFTYTIVSTGGVAASVVGLYSYNGATSDFTGAARDWTGGPLNGVFIANNATNGLHYWNGDAATRLRKFPSSNICDAARPFKNYIVMLAPTVSGVKQPHTVAWSASADPGTIPSSFTASATNDAGDSPFCSATSGTLIDCHEYGDVNYLYKDDSVFGMQYIGGNDVFRFYQLPIAEGVLAKNCIVNTPKGQVFISANWDVRIHRGGESKSIAEGRVRSVLKLISPSNRSATFLALNPYGNEVWVVFPSGSATVPDTALIWNWDDDTWGSKTLAGMKCACNGLVLSALGSEYMILGGVIASANKIGIVELSVFDFVAGFQSSVERTGLSFGDTDSVKMLQRSRHQVDGSSALLCGVNHGSSMTAKGVVTYAGVPTFVNYDVATNFAAQRAPAGRYLAVKFILGYSVIGSVITLAKLRTSELEYSKGGRR